MTEALLQAAPRAGSRPGRNRSWSPVLALGIVAVLLTGVVWSWWRGHLGPLVLRPHCEVRTSARTAALSPAQTGHAATIALVAVDRDLPARAASVGIATAMQESKLRNLRYGDRDSLGLFQQRPSQGWGTREQVLDPVYAANAFYDVLDKVEGFQNLPITEAAQRVQRSAFPSAYANHEPQARAFASALSGYSAATLHCVLRPPAPLPTERPGASGLTARARAVAGAARRETGHRTVEAASGDGTAVRFRIRGSEPRRKGWSLAQWAVARADGLNIVEVTTDGRRWQRARPGARWERGSGAPVPAGTVLVRVARGEPATDARSAAGPGYRPSIGM
jgi:hypothetical protein